MIKRLRRRMTLLVILVLIAVSAGIVLAIHLSNERSIAVQAENTLSALAEGSGPRPSMPPDGAGPGGNGETPPPKPEGDETGPGDAEESPPPVRRVSRNARSA